MQSTQLAALVLRSRLHEEQGAQTHESFSPIWCNSYSTLCCQPDFANHRKGRPTATQRPMDNTALVLSWLQGQTGAVRPVGATEEGSVVHVCQMRRRYAQDTQGMHLRSSWPARRGRLRERARQLGAAALRSTSPPPASLNMRNPALTIYSS